MIIGIGGCSRSGKSTLTDALIWEFRLQNKQVLALHIDDFVKNIELIPKINNETDWESELSIDFELLKSAIDFYKSKVDILIIEGYHFFNFKELVEKSNCAILMQIEENTFLERRKLENRWGKEAAWYLKHVWNTWQLNGKKFLNPAKTLILSGEETFDIKKIIEQILENR